MVTRRHRPRRVCLFAQYDAGGRIAPHVHHYLDQIAQAGFETHVALSGARHVADEDRVRLEAHGIRAHPRRNAGLDFGAWSDLMAMGVAEGADTVLLANDSVFGPLQPLGPIVDAMESEGSDIWAMTESREGRWHLQSWFLCLSAAALARPAIRRVLDLPFAGMTKNEIVLHGELGLGAAIEAEGLAWACRWRQPRRRLRRLVPGNPMHVDFLSVIRSGQVPFLKVDLLRDNPAGIGWVGHWRRQAELSAIFDPAWIDAYLSHAGRPAQPPARQSLRMKMLYAAISSDQPEATLSLLRPSEDRPLRPQRRS